MFQVIDYPTQNLGGGTNDRLGVLVHHTAGQLVGDLRTLTEPGLSASGGSVSAHALIARDGTRYILAPDDAVTWHAGRSRWRERDYCNSFMVGVEFEGDTTRAPLTEAQVQSFVEWFMTRAKRYGWTEREMEGHAAVRAAWNAKHPGQLATPTACMDSAAPDRLRAASRSALGPTRLLSPPVPLVSLRASQGLTAPTAIALGLLGGFAYLSIQS